MSEWPLEPTEQETDEPATPAEEAPEHPRGPRIWAAVWARFLRSPSIRMAVGAVVTVAIAVAGAFGVAGVQRPVPTAAVTASSAPVTGPAVVETAGHAAALPPAPAPGATTPLAAEPTRTAEGLSVSAKPVVVAGTTAAAAPKAVTYAAIAGIGCTGAGTSYAHYGWFKAGNGGWWTLAQGSTREGGCGGQFDDMPLSGQVHVDTAGQAMVFGFRVGGAAQTCALDFYVPTSPSARDVVVHPVHFAVLTGTGVDSPVYTSPAGDRFLSQRDHHESWLSLGSYPVRNGTIGIKITNRGSPYGYPVSDPHVAGGAVRASCVAA
ncbi:hypothetical protein [Actinoplanes sp. L3-i22]|uniref:hypothetical protein n=1 Tax=Actinoplanes sp. L3-i22 TaxID=2836373 RepID=UPI001C758D0F|nr:hypothetical protein [Actinoplanes sp. L3-i22]BCY07253.1 hypothetical protein L3i22_023410 [Actinoplanes sp. L3-i22]